MLKLVKLTVLAAAIALPTASYAVIVPPQLQTNGRAQAVSGSSAAAIARSERGSAVINSINVKKTISSGINPDG